MQLDYICKSEKDDMIFADMMYNAWKYILSDDMEFGYINKIIYRLISI